MKEQANQKLEQPCRITSKVCLVQHLVHTMSSQLLLKRNTNSAGWQYPYALYTGTGIQSQPDKMANSHLYTVPPCHKTRQRKSSQKPNMNLSSVKSNPVFPYPNCIIIQVLIYIKFLNKQTISEQNLCQKRLQGKVLVVNRTTSSPSFKKEKTFGSKRSYSKVEPLCQRKKTDCWVHLQRAMDPASLCSVVRGLQEWKKRSQQLAIMILQVTTLTKSITFTRQRTYRIIMQSQEGQQHLTCSVGFQFIQSEDVDRIHGVVRPTFCMLHSCMS